MARFKVHEHALELRKLGKSYSQIKQELGVSKSTLSVWLRKFPLSKEQIDKLRGKSEIRIEKYRQTMHAKRDKRLALYYQEEKSKLLPFSKRELLIAGLFLYWGEGAKTVRHTVSINNTDPAVLKFTLYWMRKALRIPKEKIRVFLHLYDDMNINKEIDFWSKELNMSKSFFSKPYIKKSTRVGLTQKGFGHGTCGIRCNNTILKERILMGLLAVTDYYKEESRGNLI